MSEPAKFMFDLAFDGPVIEPPVPHEEVEALKLRHAAELEQLRADLQQQSKEAREQGVAEGREEALRSIDKQVEVQIGALLSHRQQLEEQVEAVMQQIRTLCLRLALQSAEKLAKGLVAEQPQAQLEAFFKDCLALLPTRTELRLHASPQLAEALQPKLEALMQRAGLQNQLLVYADEDIEGADCRLLWPEGGIEHSWQNTSEQIGQIVEAYLQARRPAQTAPDKPASASEEIATDEH